ncbi:hypothetical protein DB30_06305 [Enhygromyxa salina]|uniref:PDZ domain-containing protein n=1 Tax=Enhygromyxa salina TaxID=215803 RepID=A0A0C2CUQ2_9BACT|nr:carboxypeptidase regulatory-like domain-containing protein [Enhygromyxa salina]KIG14851.1 hypothetical protein DB30_06305 [Enhygromyxa salina]
MPSPNRTLALSFGGFAILVVALLLGWKLYKSNAPALEPGGPGATTVVDAGDVIKAPGKRERADLQLAAKASIRGVVRDPAGQPIANAQVCGFAVRDAVRDALRGLGDGQPRCTTTEADGHYRLDGLWPVPTNIEASAPTFKPARWQTRDDTGQLRDEVRLTPGGEAVDIDLLLQPGGVLVKGVVRDITGGEIEGAVVIGRPRGIMAAGLAVTRTGDDGRFELWAAPGSLSILARSEGYADGDVPGVAPGALIEVFLTPESVLVGQVIHAQTKQPVSDVTVRVSGRRMGQSDHSTRTDDDGWYRLDRLEPGTYKPIAQADELYGEAAEQVNLGLGETSDPVQILVHPAFLVSGTVSIAGGEGRPCPDGSILLRADQRTHGRDRLDDEGVAELRGVLPGVYQVEVRCDGYITEDSYPAIELVDASLTGLSWTVREGLAIRGEVVDDAGSPVADISIAANALLAGDDARGRKTDDASRSDEAGHFELTGLLPGRYEVSLSSRSGRPGPDPIPVELLAGADVNDLRLVLPAVGQLRGHLLDERGQGVAGVWVAAAPVGAARGQSAQTDDAGAFAFQALQPGPTRVSPTPRSGLRAPGTTDDDPQGQVIEVVANETVELDLIVETQAGVIRGAVVDEHGSPVADAFVDAERMSDRAGASARSSRQAMRWSWGRKPVLTDQDGRFELDELPDGVFLVRAHRKGGGEASLEEVAIGADVELVIATTGSLGGTVVDPGNPAPERFRVVARDPEQGISIGDEFFRTNGVWALRELPPGSYSLSASSSAGTTELEVVLGEGEQRDDLVLELESRVTIRGRIIDLDTREGIAGFEVNAAGPGGGRRRLRVGDLGGDAANVTDADGRFELPEVPSGRTRIIARLRTGGADKPYDFAFTVREIQPTPAVQDIGDIEAIARRVERGKQPGELGYTIVEPDPSAAPEDSKIVVALVRPGGPAAAAGLEVGAVIESVDGHAIGGDANRYRTLSQVPAGATITLGLEQGASVKITAAAPL